MVLVALLSTVSGVTRITSLHVWRAFLSRVLKNIVGAISACRLVGAIFVTSNTNTNHKVHSLLVSPSVGGGLLQILRKSHRPFPLGNLGRCAAMCCCNSPSTALSISGSTVASLYRGSASQQSICKRSDVASGHLLAKSSLDSSWSLPIQACDQRTFAGFTNMISWTQVSFSVTFARWSKSATHVFSQNRPLSMR